MLRVGAICDRLAAASVQFASQGEGGGLAAHRGRSGNRPYGVLFGICGCLVLVLACASSPTPTPSAAKHRVQTSAVEAVDQYIDQHPVDVSDPSWKTHLPRPPVVEFDPDVDYYWFLHTSAGGIKIQLKPEWAPAHVTSTIYLTRLGFYDGLGFHRIIPKFMVQGGDPLGTGRGGPGYRMAGEFHRKARHNKRGVVSAANRGPRTDGSQFFILFSDEGEHLDGKHTVYGQVVEGLGTLRTLEMYGTETGEPTRIVVIRRSEILEQ